MKKRFIALLLVLVMSISLMGCSKNNDNDNNNGVDVNDNNEIDNNEANKDDKDENKDPIINDDDDDDDDDDKDDDMDDKDDLDDDKDDDNDIDDDNLSDEMKTTIKSEMFEPITNLQVGTPGSSLDALVVSAEWLNVLGDYDIDDDAFVKELKNYYEGLSSEDQEVFKENYSFLSETMLMLAKRDEGIIESLSTAGVSLSDEALDEDDFMEVDRDVKVVLGL